MITNFKLFPIKRFPEYYISKLGEVYSRISQTKNRLKKLLILIYDLL